MQAVKRGSARCAAVAAREIASQALPRCASHKENNTMSDRQAPGPSTRAVWAGEEEPGWQGATQVPVVHSVSYGYTDLDRWHDVALGKAPGHIYSRNTNPTVAVFEEKMRQLEGAEAATSFSSGMAAISNTLHALLRPGQRLVSINDTYGGTNRIFTHFLPRLNIATQLCPTSDHEAIEAEIAKGCRVVYLETPTNPTLKVVDIARLAAAGHAKGAVVIVDNTVATPINTNPLTLGADLVVHSATKYIGGHADALGGVLCGSKELVREVFAYREINGAALEPQSAYMMIRSLKTLALRIERQNANAMQVARFLKSHAAVEEVFYPGLECHGQHAIARKQMRGFGGMLSFLLRGDFGTVRRFLPRLRYAHLAANLGPVETVAGPPRTTSHVEVSAEQRAALGIPETLVRYSVGIEDVDDLIADLEGALSDL
jgi:cystathionine gamma-synthase